MEAKRELYSIGEVMELLSLSAKEVHHLADEYQLTKRPGISAESIADYARRKRIVLKQEIAVR
jgi:DNA-binding transcriptional MerR regulator